MRLPLVGGAYSARSIIANSQRCINLYPERNGNGAPVPLTHYQRPGLRPLVTSGGSVVRNIYRASNGNGYCTIDSTVYAISPSWGLTAIGSVSPGLVTPVSMVDNGATIAVVDGSTSAWLINMSTNAYSAWSDPLGYMRGGDRVDYIDGFLIMNVAQANGNNNEWISTTLNTTDFTDGYYAFKTAYPDPLMTLCVNHNYIFLLGQLKSEVWYNAGLATFPFAMLVGTYIEHGIAAKYSLAMADIKIFMLSQDLQGHGVVHMINGGNFTCTRISNHALEYQIRLMANTVGISDAIGYTYQQDGHYFYVLTFPSGDQTWVYDDSLGEDPTIAWHQEAWTDPSDGSLHRHRGNCHGFINGTNVVGDFENGTLYAMDLDVYTDTVAGTVCTNTYIRTFPHLGTGEVEIGIWGKRPIPADGRRVRHTAFMLDLECGLAPESTVALRYSDDRGRTFSSDVLQTTGEQGQYLTQPIWRGLGMARDRVYEVEFAAQGPATLNGAWVEGEVLET